MDYLIDSSPIDEEAQLAVKRGAYWMDENYPGWAERIDLHMLDMNNCNQCIIGQAVCDYFAMISTNSQFHGMHFNEFEEWAYENGFNVPDADDYKYGYGDLEASWTIQVDERLG